jgi:hypothetical protein
MLIIILLLIIILVLVFILYKLRNSETFISREILYQPLPFQEKANDFSINYKKNKLEPFGVVWEEISQTALKNAPYLNN